MANEEFWAYKRSLTAEQVLDDELVLAGLGTLESYKSPFHAMDALLKWHIELSIDKCFMNSRGEEE